MTITLNRADLDFLLRQVTVNYLVPDGNGGFVQTVNFNYSALANAVDPSGLREVSGSNNNLVGGHFDPNAVDPLTGQLGVWVPGPNGAWGQASQQFLNLAVGQTDASAPVNGVNGYNNPGGAVIDAAPRLISNLVASSITDPTSPLYNPAMAAVATNGDPLAQHYDPAIGFVANAGVLGGGRYNGWFVAFGQFFDHGLDFVNRDTDPTATVTVNLSPLDPLYDADGANNIAGDFDDVTSIQIRRAAVANAGDAGGDGIFGTADDAYHAAGADGALNTADDIYSKAQYVNQTGLLIDQSQTYGSHQSVNALIREYTADGRPTGRVVSGNTGVLTDANPLNDIDAKGLATWADIKLNALRIGVILNDTDDLHNAPVLRVNPVGKLLFTPDATDLYDTSQIIGYDPNNQDPNDPFVRDAAGNVLRTGQNLLIDFNPGIPVDQHIITGDGRGNENIGLTSVHHVFHEEHNGQVENIKQSTLKQALLANDLALLNGDAVSGGWLSTNLVSFADIGLGAIAGDAAAVDALFADPAALAAALGGLDWNGERLYQSARIITESEYNHIAIDQYVGTLYGALPEFVSYSSDINMGVSLEFSQAVFRLGHSMLTETFNVIDPETQQPLRLLDMFLDPTKYQEIGPTALAQGLTLTLGNEVDEFVTPALQQSLLGQPLDLASINIARGRDVGLPTWNEFRDQIHKQYIQNTNNTNGSALAPYTNWADVFDHLKNPLTGVNFIAAYGRDTGGAFDWGINEARAAYQAGTGTLEGIRAAAQAVYDAYGNAADPNHAAAVTFMEGTPTYSNGEWTFPGADQGFWDIDLWIGGLAERPLFDGPLGTTFSYVILDFAQRQQDGDRFYYLFRTPMGTNLGNEIVQNQFTNLVMETTGLTHLNGEIFIREDARYELGAGNDYFNAAALMITDVEGNPMQASAGHLVIAGNEGHDFIIAGLGDDTVYGDAGDDTIQGSQGNDHLFGGAGNDLITDDENDDFISGGTGNDRIFAGGGALDTVFGDEGDDELHGGDGIDEVLGGTGDDMIYGDGDTDVLFGDDGNDYVDGGDSVDEMQGQAGNDWLRGGVGDDHLIGGDGNDLMEGGIGPTANDGDRLVGQGVIDFAPAGTVEVDVGIDVASYEDVDIAITANLDTSNANGTGGLLDTYAGIDGLVGGRFNDNLTGAGPDTITNNGITNLIVGGGGNDVLTGLGGDDQMFGDSVVVKNDLSVYLGPIGGYSDVANWKGTGDSRPDFGALGGLGHYLGEVGAVGTTDMAVFSGLLSDYTITFEGPTTVRLVDNRGIDSTIIGDLVKDVELFQFSNGSGGTVIKTLAELVNAAPTDIQWNGVVPGQSALPGAGAVIANLATVDPDSASWTYTLQAGSSAGFAVNTAGVVTRTGSAMAANTTYTLVIRSTDNGGKFRDETFTLRTNGNGDGNLVAFATPNDDVQYGDDGNDTLAGGGGNDTLFGMDEDDTLDGGAGNDVLNGGTGDSDTASYASAALGVTVSLATALQQDTLGAGLDTLVDIENLSGSASSDTLTGNTGGNTLNGGAGVDTMDGGAGGDVLIGGIGADIINTGSVNDNVTDIIRLSATADYGDIVSNFDATGNNAQVDRVELTGALNTAFDDGNLIFNNDQINFATGNGAAGTVNANINPALFSTNIEGLMLTGANSEGVTNLDLLNLAAVANAFNTEFVITANNGADALLVINDTDTNNFALYQWVQAGGGEVAAGEITLIGLFNANATVTAGSFDFI